MPQQIPLIGPAGERGTLEVPDGADPRVALREALQAGWKPTPEQPGESAKNLLRQGSEVLGAARASTQEQINSFLRTLAEPRLPAPTEEPMPGTPFESRVGQAAAGLLNPVPGSIPEVAALGAYGVGRAAVPAARTILGPLVGAGAAGGGFTGTALVEGRDPIEALMGGGMVAAASLIPEGFGAAWRAGRDLFRTRLGMEAYQALTVKDATPIIQAISEDVPALEPFLRSDKPLSLERLVDATPGRPSITIAEGVVKRLRDHVDHDAADYFGDTNLAPHLPSIVSYFKSRRGLSPQQEVNVPAADAQRMLIEMKARARMALAGREPAASRIVVVGTGKKKREFDIVDLARDAEEQYLSVLPPDHRAAYIDANDQYGKTLDLVTAIQEGLKSERWIVGHPKGRGVDMGELAAYLDEKRSELGMFRFPALYEAAHRGTQEMARDILISRGAPELQRLGGHIPGTPLFVTGRAGSIPSQRFFPAGFEGAGRTGLQDLMNLLAIMGTAPLREEGPSETVRTGRVPGGR